MCKILNPVPLKTPADFSGLSSDPILNEPHDTFYHISTK